MKPVKLILFLVILGIVIFFIGFNLSNVSDIAFGFHTFSDVPIFISLFISFAAGVLVMLPFCFSRSKKSKRKLKSESPSASSSENNEEMDETEKT